jgi:hypothetical protein
MSDLWLSVFVFGGWLLVVGVLFLWALGCFKRKKGGSQ